MSKEMVISASRHETRVALLEEDQLVEVHFQRSNEYSLAASIHKGRVTRVLPGMQSAFVDLGLERDTFLYVSDFLEETEDIDRVSPDDRGGRESGNRESGSRESAGRESGSRESGSRDRGGRDRGRDRDRQQQGPPPVPAQIQPPPIPAEALLSAPEGEASAPPAGVASVPSAGRAAEAGSPQGDRQGDRPGERNDQGDRRGRRSRRRRHRGRGFPDSKYADASGATSGPAPVSTEADRETEPEPEASPQQSTPSILPVILPGESLRKYRGGAPEAEVAPPPGVEETVLVEESLLEDEGEEEYDEPIHYPPDNTLPDAPVHHPVLAEPQEPQGTTTTPAVPAVPGFEATPPPAPAAHVPQVAHVSASATMPPAEDVPVADESGAPEDVQAEDTQAEDSQDDEQQGDSASGPAVAPGLDEDEDRDIQAMILGEVEELDEDSEPESEEPSPASAEPGVEAAPLEAESGTAEVRERGGRFPHRISRRMRGRRRGSPDSRGGAPDSRGGSDTRGDSRPDGRPEGRSGDAAAAETRESAPPTRPQEQRVSRPAPHSGNQNQPSISDLLKEGQEIIVQIAKEPLGQKGARITSHIALPGRYVVYIPATDARAHGRFAQNRQR